MTAKQYLQQLQKLDLIIKQKTEELATLRGSTNGIGTEGERVQTSSSKDPLGDGVVRMVVLEDELWDEIERFNNLKHDIIKGIQRLDNVTHIDVLYKRYVQYKPLSVIAAELNYAYQYVLNLHGMALRIYQSKYNML